MRVLRVVDFAEALENAVFTVRRARTGTVEDRIRVEYVLDRMEVEDVFRAPMIEGPGEAFPQRPDSSSPCLIQNPKG